MEYEIYNPHNKPIEDLPVIYGFNNGGSHDWWQAQLIAEDGTLLGGHICSNEDFMRGDLGITKGSYPKRHETFRKHYPDGYKMDFVSGADARIHAGLNKAFENYKKLPADKKSGEGDNPTAVVEFSDGTKVDCVSGEKIS